MSSPFNRALLLCLLMLAAAGLTIAAKPSQKLADQGPKIDLERIVPESFSGWTITRSILPISISPEVQARLEKIYNQTLTRTYVNSAGQRVMLSMAYGGDQSDAMQVHRPEVCYAAQGFEIVKQSLAQLVTDFGVLPVKRLVALQGARNEPITYWIVIGDQVTQGGFMQKLVQLKYGLSGRIPDGILVRVSTIDRNEAQAYQLQDQFLATMLGAIPPGVRPRIVGRFGA
jgi:EpsI family protein